MSVFQRARQGIYLSPAARALLKLIEGFIIAGVVAALPVLSMLLGQATVDWTAIGRIALGGVLRGAFQNAYLGYWIDTDRQGQGLMTEAVRAATSFALTSG